MTPEARERVLAELKELVTKEDLIRWTEALRGWQLLKKEEMTHEIGQQIPEHERLDGTVEEIAGELDVPRSRVREAFRPLQEEHCLRPNYSQVKDAAIKQLLQSRGPSQSSRPRRRFNKESRC